MHLSYSALDLWSKCPFAFKIKYVDKSTSFRGSLYSCFGTAVHKTIELILTGSFSLENSFKQNFDSELSNLDQSELAKISSSKELLDIKKNMYERGTELSLAAVTELSKKFPGFKLVAIEEKILELVHNVLYPDYDFKGIIDLIIQSTDGNYHIIDWKTCSWGWDARKKSNKMVTYQLTFYKHYFGLREGIDNKNIETHFALLKRTAKKDKDVEIFKVPVGEKKINNALKVLDNMIHNVERKNFIKNRLSCKMCDFHKTTWCP